MKNDRHLFYLEDTPDYHRAGSEGKKPAGKDGGNLPKKKIPIVWVIVIDVLIAALLFFLFSLYYVILPRDMSGEETALPRPSKSATVAPTAAATQTAAQEEPQATQTPVPTPTSDGTAWGANFPGVFTDGDVEQTDTSYKSGNISISIEKKTLNEVNYYVADIYIKD